MDEEIHFLAADKDFCGVDMEDMGVMVGVRGRGSSVLLILDEEL